jgi:DNA-binding NarL/FixJ family response regulator
MKTSTKPVRVLIADDHEILREGIVSVLSTMEAIDVVGEANNAEMAVVLFEQLRPDVTVLDLKMPLMGGIEAIKAIRRIDSAARILALTAYQGDVLAREVLAAGASGYMLKRGMRKELVEAINNIANGFKHISLDVALELGHYFDSDLLSKRELEVLRYVATGNTNRKIAELMGLSEETIKTHLKTILAKTNARDRTHAVTIALQRGMLRV